MHRALLTPLTLAALLCGPTAARAEEATAPATETPSEAPEDPAPEPPPAPEAPAPEAPAPEAPAPEAPAPEAPAPETPPAPEAPTTPPLVDYHKGFRIRSADQRFSLTINARVQPRFTFENEPGEDGRSSSGAFSIARARLKLTGSLFDEAVVLTLHVDFSTGTIEPKDLAAVFQVVPEQLYVSVGQFKKPDDRASIASSSKLQLVERAITEKYFGDGRDVGVMLHNDPTQARPVEWSVGIFNGTSERATLDGGVQVDVLTGVGSITGARFNNVPARPKPMLAARGGFILGDLNAYDESEPGKGRSGVAVAASGQWTFDADQSGAGRIRGILDWIARYHDLSASGGFFLASTQSGETWSEQAFDAFGVTAQVGYAIAARVEPALRYARIVRGGDDDDRQEFTLGVTGYVQDDAVKICADASALVDEAPGGQELTWRARVNLEVGF